ncbi:MAG TPA: 50S ribosomal protein L15 [Desulfobulbaceae bacterium]|nr:50S ribosomal protein L15 [Desulfobulbaceae bacterium]
MKLSNLSPNQGSTKNRKRLGRGPGSGHGKTAGRGHKGFKARSGNGVKMGFEGGQMPLQRRLPKRGFRSRNQSDIRIIGLELLDKLSKKTAIIDEELLITHGVIKAGDCYKLLSNGEISSAVQVRLRFVSAGARSKIEAAGGQVLTIE